MERKTKTKQKDHIVKESNSLARAKIKPAPISVWDMRVIATMAARNMTSDEVFREHRIDLKEINGGKALSTDQFSKAKKAICELAHKTYEIQLNAQDAARLKRGVDVYPIFSRIQLESNDVITAKFNPDLRPHYLNLRKYFTLLSLPDFQKLTSIYAQKMYEILCSWRSEGEVEIPLGELYLLLSVPASLKMYKNFKEKVLEVAHREINEAAKKSSSGSPLEFEWEAVKEGKRKVIAVRFILNVSERRTVKAVGEAMEVIHEVIHGRTNNFIEPTGAETAAAAVETDGGDDAVKSAGRCYIERYNGDKADCKPDRRTKRCQYCTEFGFKSREARPEKRVTKNGV